MKSVSLLILLILAATTALGGGHFSYEDYGDVLTRHVNEAGFVDYAGLQKYRERLDRFADAMAGLETKELAGWSREERLAFWINAYNALTLKAVVDHYPVKSIKDIGTPLKSVWDKLTFDVAGRKLTLNQIEHEILRKEFKEPYIHIAINCASIGCPPLLNKPYAPGDLAVQFDAQTRQFLANPKNFTVRGKEGAVSRIFKWFGGDFVGKYGSPKREGLDETEGAVLNFVAGHVDEETQRTLSRNIRKVVYLDYDWNLNRQ